MPLKQIATMFVVIGILFSFGMVSATTPIQVATSHESEIIVAAGNISGFAWSSDGTRLAYVKHLDGQSWGELWVCDWDGYSVTNHQLLYSEIETNGLLDWQGDWILLRIRHENGDPTEYYGRGELWKIRDDGTELTQITFTYTDGIKSTENGYYIFRGSAGWGRFVPGTDLVYFSAHNGNGWWKAYTCNADGTDEWTLISGSTFSFTIGMSPKGNKLVWGTSWYWDEPTTLLSSDVDGSHTVTMKEFSFKTSPLVLADGDTVLYNCPDGNIGAIQVDGSNERFIVEDEYSNFLVNYNPVDGQSFLMRSNNTSDGNTHIFSVDAEGTSVVQLTDGPYNDDTAMYSPNGHNLAYRRLPVSENVSYELVITWIGMQIRDLPSASISMLLVGDESENIINATITIGLYSNGNYTGIGYHQELLHISSEETHSRAVGLGYDEMQEHSFICTTQGNVTDDLQDPNIISSRKYAAWTESEWYGTWRGPISKQNITDAILFGDIIKFEKLRVYFNDGSSVLCGPQVITLSAYLTKTGETYETHFYIATSDDEGVTIDNNVVTISIRYPEYVPPIVTTTIITIIVVVAVVAIGLYLKSRFIKPEYQDEFVQYF